MADVPELPMAKMAKWKDNWTANMIKTIVLSILFLICLILLFNMGSIKEIAENFPKYRCNPIIMPFASNFGYDTKENFNFCLTSIFNKKAAEIFAPIYNILGGFTDIVKMIVDVALGIRKLFSNFFLGVNSFIRNTRDRIQSVFFSIRMTFLKINNLMARVYGTMYAVMWMGVSAMTVGSSIGQNDIVKSFFALCFDPLTPVELKSGKFVPISQLVIGDELAAIGTKTPIVESIFRFSGDKTDMVMIDDVKVSENHYVVGPGNKWMPANLHPSAVKIPSLPELVCLNVSGHKFKIGKHELIVADYDEHSSEEVVNKAQKMAMSALNGQQSEKDAVEDYSLGVDGQVFVRMENDTWVPIKTINIGDSVWNSGKVLGIVKEKSDSVVCVNGNNFATAQAIYDPESKSWVRAGAKWPQLIENNETILYSLITMNCSTLHISDANDTEYHIRDYREVPLPEMETPYTEAF